VDWLWASSVDPIDGRPGDERAFDSLVRRIWLQKGWIIGVTIVSLAVALATVGFLERRYTSEAIVRPIIQPEGLTRVGKDTAPEQAADLDPADLASQVQLITSRDLAQQAILKLDMFSNPEFNPPSAGILPIDRLLIMLGVESDLRKAPPEDRVLRAYYDRLQVNRVPSKRALDIAFSASNPDFAAKAANVIAELYLSLRGQVRNNVAALQGEPITDPAEALESKVAELDNKIKTLRAQSGPWIGGEKGRLPEQRLSELTKQLAAARKTLADTQAKANLIEERIHQGRYSAIPAIAGNEPIRRIASKSAALHDQLALDSQTYLPRYPRMQELRVQVADVDNALRAEAERVARGLESQSRTAGGRVEALTASLNSQSKTSEASNALRALERDAAAARDELDRVRAKHGEALTDGSDNSALIEASFVSRAVPAQLPSFTKDIPTLLVSAFGGLLLSFGAVVGRELFHGSSLAHRDRGGDRRPEAVDAVLDRDYAMLPAALDRSPAAMPIAATAAGSIEARALDRREPLGLLALAVRIEQLKPQMRGAAVLVCGLDGAAASGAAAVEISRVLARNSRTILVDARDEVAGFADSIGDQDFVGAADQPAGPKSPVEAVHRDPGVQRSDRSHESAKIDPRRFDAEIDALVATRDYVVLNGPTLASSDSAFDLASWVDMIVLVATRGASSSEILTVIDRLVDAGCMNVQLLTADDDA